MKLSEWLYHFNAYVKMYPQLLNVDIIYSIDEEGNEFKDVCMTPSLAKINRESANFIGNDVQFLEIKDIKECNAIIIN